ncbi:MAG: tRNA pseudouridine(55) synthase TruB [Dehalococcoidia bacterium]|nr:tRNA pseudouridine(55) synthase TruB [Dehalococcoidia bacterium]
MKRKEPVLNGILLVDKPAGWTSHDVVARCRRFLGERRIGHTGTLDPAATGLLVLCVGHATRLVEEMTAHSKRYIGEIRLGVATDSDDATGTVINERPVPEFGDEVLRKLERQFSGVIEQTPPAFSAIQSGGRRAYAAARAGTPLELAARRVTVHELHLRLTGPSALSVSVHCGPGTYIRSLARDIGAALGCGGHLSSLRRESVGSFAVADGWQLAEIEAVAARRMASDILLPIDEGLTAMNAAILSGDHIEDVLHGRRVQLRVPDGRGERTPVRVYGDEGALVAVGALEPDGVLRPKKVLARPD